MPIHPLQILSELDPVHSEDPLKRAGTLEALRNTMGQGLIQQQTIAANQDAAKTRQAGIAADAEVAKILQTAQFDVEGNLDANTEAALVKNGSPHAQAILTNISTVSSRKSNIQRDKDLTQQGKDTLAETNRHNTATELVAQNKPLEVSANATLVPPTQQLPYTAPGPSGAPRNIDPLSEEGIAAAYEREKKLASVPNRSSGGITPTAEANLQTRLVNQWEKASKDVQELYRANTIMDAGMKAARAGDMNAGSQAVLVTFQKFLDPTSVVRESEYARSGAGQSMANRITGAIEKLASGGAGMTLPELEKFAAMGKEISANLNKEGASLLSAQKKRIKATADRYGVPIETIIPDYNYAQPGGTAPAAVRRYNPATGKIE